MIKSIKKTIGLLFLGGVLITSANSCKKYEEGPTISLRSKTARVSNVWKIEKYLENGTDKTTNFTNSNYTVTLTEDGNYSYSYTFGSSNVTGSGKWEFQNKDTEIKISGINGVPSQTLIILRLKESEFWYYHMDGNDKDEFHLIPN
jgi:hypothetical protein